MKKQLTLCINVNNSYCPVDLGKLSAAECREVAHILVNNANWLSTKADLLDDLDATINAAIIKVVAKTQEDQNESNNERID